MADGPCFEPGKLTHEQRRKIFKGYDTSVSGETMGGAGGGG